MLLEKSNSFKKEWQRKKQRQDHDSELKQAPSSKQFNCYNVNVYKFAKWNPFIHCILPHCYKVKCNLHLILQIGNVCTSLWTFLQPVLVPSPWWFSGLKIRGTRSYRPPFPTPGFKRGKQRWRQFVHKENCRIILFRWCCWLVEKNSLGLFCCLNRILLASFTVSTELFAWHEMLTKRWINKTYLSSSVVLSEILEQAKNALSTSRVIFSRK